jgi:hypothetical protein
MKEQLDEQLVKRYPKIFRDRHGDIAQTCMVWGFECGDGWFNIINQLCSCIQNRIDWSEKAGSSYVIEQVVATQVKEKFGGLRFYYNGGDNVIDGMVGIAEAMSTVTCEQCGCPGKIFQKKSGWITTLCERHRDDGIPDKQYISSENC